MLTEYDRVVVISDLHITPHAHLGNFPEAMGEQLVQLTSKLASEQCQRTALVLAGDIIDFLLVDDNRTSFEIARFGRLMTNTLQELKQNHEWFRRWAEELKNFGERGGQVILIPGNHDPEWFSKAAADDALKVLFNDSPCPWFQVHTAGDVWHAKVGSQHVKVLHGHTCDWWNDIDRAGFLQAINDCQNTFPFPIGSQLVAGPILAFKREQVDGRPRFPFIDSLKPENPGVYLLLLALDPDLFVRHHKPHGPELTFALINSLKRRLHQRLNGFTRTMLGPELAEWGEQTTSEDRALTEIAFELAEAFNEILTDADLNSRDFLIGQVESYFGELKGLVNPIGTDRSLGATNAISWYFLRAWLQWERTRASAANLLDPQKLSHEDEKIITRYSNGFSSSAKQQVIVAGHTHAPRLLELDHGITYCNTGTWTNLIQLGHLNTGSPKELNAILNQLLKNEIPVKCAPTWAEITTEGVALRSQQNMP